MPDNSLLYLYSSNQAHLYEQDVLDVLAAPRGGRRQFRYFQDYLTAELRANVEAVIGTTALIHFSLQQEEQYHSAVVIPVRWATVQDVGVTGDVYTFQLRMDGWCSLKAPRTGGKVDFASKESRGSKKDTVVEYQKWLEAHNVPRPYNASAGSGSDVRQANILEPGDNDALFFNFCVQYLRSTRSFSNARFYRIQALRALGGTTSDAREVEADEEGVFVLAGGKTYIIELSHFQPALPQTTERVRVSTDGKTVLLIGKPEFEIASRYDVIPLEVHVVEPSTIEAQETAILVEPDGSMFGARIRLRLRVLRSPARTAAAVGGAAMVAVLLGVPSLWTTLPVGLKALSITLAAVMTGLLASSGLKR